jgi:hypothetical protein
MASPEENLREELVRFLTHIAPSRLPQRAVALAPCCTPALKLQCEAADAALARLRRPKPTHVVSVTVPAGPTLCRNQISRCLICTRLTG